METTVEMLFVKGLKPSTKERQQEWWQAQHQLQWERRSVEEVDFMNATEKEIIFLMTWSLTKLRREGRERVCTLWKFPLFSAKWNAHLFFGPLLSINFHHSLQSFFTKKSLMLFAMMYIFTYLLSLSSMRKEKWGDFLPTILPVFLCQLFS